MIKVFNASIGTCFLAVIAVTFLSTSAQAALVGLYQFNDASNAGVANDSSQNQNHGTVLGGAFYTASGGGVTGAAGDRAMVFGAGASRVTVAANMLSSITANNQVTIAAWVFGQSQPQEDTLFSLNQSGARQVLAHLPWSDSNVYFDTGGCCGANTRLSGSALPASNFNGAWNHWAFVKDGNNKTIYLNGNVLLNQVGTATTVIGAFNEAVIGAFLASGNSNDYSGLIDDFAIFDNALTQAQIRQAMNGHFIPEPATAALALVSLGGLMLRRRRMA